MRKLNLILLSLTIFIAAVILAVNEEDRYRCLVRWFFKLFQGDKIEFFGKNFHLFASPYLIISFGLFTVILFIFLRNQSTRRIIAFLASSIALFFLTTIISSYFDSSAYVSSCTACPDGVNKLRYNTINYDLHFIISLAAGLIPVCWTFTKQLILKYK